MAKAQQKKYATVGNPTINATLQSLYRFASREQAHARIAQLKEHFIASKLSSTEQTPHTAIIWIIGYAVSEEEKAQGYKGNYALISCTPQEDKFTLSATKISSELRFHPQRVRPAQKHPDWGHPILRDIKKKRIYFTAEEAAQELQRLHEAFPDISIPDQHRLMIILYEKTPGVKSPVQKYKFDIKALAEGGFIITYRKNVRAKKTVIPDAQPQEGAGYFASMVAMKSRNKKKDA